MFNVDSGLSTNSTAHWTGSELFSDGSEGPEQAERYEDDQVIAKDLSKQTRKLDKGVDRKQMFVMNKMRSFNESSEA